jgi:sirohydrochlorin ferrochelatase
MEAVVKARIVSLVCLCLWAVAAAAAADESKTGILLLAHGGKPAWNESVRALAAKVDAQQPTEVAFGMAARPAIQSAVHRLIERGASTIVAVPLFVSSHSSVITSTEYLLGLRSEAPADLAVFARMKHGHGAAEAGHHDESADNTRPVDSRVPIRMAPALGRHPVVSEILLTRATAISHDPSEEALVIVAHGPVPEEDNRAWLADMAVVAGRIRKSMPFASVDWLTVRDDAPAPIRDAATEELRAVVERRAAEGRRILVLPLVISFGGIEAGIRERLDGLGYTMAEHALMPDDRLAAWVLEMAATAAVRPTQ